MRVQTGTVLSSAVINNRDNPTPVRLLTTQVTDIDDIQTVELFGQAGEDYNPPIDATVAILEAGPAWKIAIACTDNILPESIPGERELYSSAGGAKIATIKLSPDGTIDIKNPISSINISPIGVIDIKNSVGSIKLTETGTIDIKNASGTININETTGQCKINDNFTVDV